MRSLHRFAPLALALSLVGSPVFAQADRAEVLGPQVAHEIFSAVNLGELIREESTKNAAALAAFDKVRPEWKPLFIQSIEETVAQDQPAMEALIGRALAKSMTVDELSAGLVFFQDPQARAAIAAGARHMAPPVVSGPPCSPACVRAMTSPAGRSFLVKMQKVLNPDLQREMLALMVPDMFIRFGEKAKAAEAKSATP